MDDQRLEEIAGTPADADLVRYCLCADPENCTEKVLGYVCRKTSYAHRSGLLQPMPLRYQDIAKEHADRLEAELRRLPLFRHFSAALGEALSSQEEELRKVKAESAAFEAEMRRVRPLADCYVAVLRHCGIENDVIGHVKRQEEELRSLREELAGVKANWALDQRVLDRTKAERDELLHVKATTAHARDLNQTRAREADAELQRLRGGMTRTAAELRHAYRQLAAGEVVNQRKFATGLLGPQVERLERLLASPVEEKDA
jgi:hypothetical protein